MKQRIAIVCDWLVSRGGAERVIAVVADMFPQAPIFTPLYNEKALPEFRNKNIHTSFLQKLPLAKNKHYAVLPLMPYAVEQFDLSEFDIVISSSHSCAKGIITKPRTLHISYCHSPMRYVWDNWQEYFLRFGIPWVLHGSAKRMLHRIRMWDRLAADRVDFFIANSQHVQARIKKYYRRDAEVIYPPIETETFTPGAKKGNYFLAVGRLTPYKRFDLLVECFNELKLPLIIVGTGKEEARLRARAHHFITFVGSVSDEELRQLYQGSLGLIFPQTEDFGITPLEAMSCGKPVIAYSEGGALETVHEEKTGLFFTEQTADSLKKAVLAFQDKAWDSELIRSHAETFDRSVFEEKLRAFIEEKWAVWKKEMV